MTVRTCGHCGERSHVTARWFQMTNRPGNDHFLHVAYTCDVCEGPTMAMDHHPSTYPSGLEQAAAVVEGDGSVWVPSAVVGRDYPDAPEQIASTADEAVRCSSIGARRGAILLARTTIEATAKDKGIDKGNLKSKIDDLADGGFIRANIAKAAHQIRLAGNDMAHGDLGVDADDEDVEQMLKLMDLVLREVYETPALVDAVTSRRPGGNETTLGSSAVDH